MQRRTKSHFDVTNCVTKWGLHVAKKVPYLLERDGRYWARLVVPPHLRPFVENKTELRAPLGPDYREAVKKIHGAVAELQFRLRQAEIRAAESGVAPRSSASFPLSDEQMAFRLYSIRLEHDQQSRRATPHYASMSVDDLQVLRLRQGFAGQLADHDLLELVGQPIDYFRKRGNTSVEFGTPDWRKLAMTLCIAEYEALARVAERDEGDFTGEPSHPTLKNVQPVVPDLPPASLKGLFEDYIATRKRLDRGTESERRWKPIFEDLRKFLKHDDANRLTKREVMAWRDHALKTRSPKTVRDVWLAALRAVLNWAVREDRLPENVAEDVRQDVAKPKRTRERGFTEEEATAILRTCLSYKRSDRENPKTAAAKRWVPLLAAHSGARVTELTQLRKEDVMKRGSQDFIRITPDAGSVKTGQYRDVPLHRQLVELGFLDFVQSSGSGPLFFDANTAKDTLSGARTVSGRLSEWLGSLGVVPEGVAPNHGWRHRFKTLGRELGYSDRVVDAICGHAGRTAGDSYGDVTLEAKQRVIDALKGYELT